MKISASFVGILFSPDLCYNTPKACCYRPDRAPSRDRAHFLKGWLRMRFDSFSHMTEYYAERTPDAPALIYGRNAEKMLSFRQFADAVNERAAVLRVNAPASYGILCDGSAECVIEIFAAALTGIRIVLLNENLPEDVLPELLAYTRIERLWGDEDLAEEMAPYLASGVPAEPGQILFFTSGTTSRSKAVVLTQQSLMASAWNGSSLLPLAPSDRLLCMLPLDHVFGFVCGVLWGLSCGAAVALGRGPRHYHEDCAFFRPTALSAVPMLWGFLVKHKALNPELKLVLIGAGDCLPALLAAGNALGIRICFGYGLTETSSGVALSIEGDPYAMTVCPDDAVTIAPDGEILLQAPTCVMRGYYHMEEATDEVLKDGIFHTGDLGSVDEDGKLHVAGRKKEMLVRADGTKIFLPEYEAECAAALGTADVCICERDGALTLIAAGTGFKEQEILQKLRSVTALRPRGQQFVKIELRDTPLPRTAGGKLKRWEV